MILTSFIRRTLVQLLKHLDMVEKHQSRNKMTKENLAIVVSLYYWRVLDI